jgi:sec-independent protein translocase protein TatB
MLDVGFSEILLTSAIALIVLGPEKLPKVARQVGNWMGRARAMARQLSEQLEREVSADELMKSTKATTARQTPMTSDPAPYDTSAFPSSHTAATPTAITPPVTPSGTPLAMPAAAASSAYSSAPDAAPHGADWHPAPPDSKSDNG